MGFNQSSAITSAFTSSKSNDLFGEVLTGCLAGLGIWTKPSPKATAARPQIATSNVFPLRVIRVKESSSLNTAAGNTPKMAGRMVISGRMADVCAELDRLAA